VKRGVEILVVDDEPAVRQSLKLVLEFEGHKVCLVDGGETALAELARRKFDVVLTDFAMPGMHGDQLVAHIRQLAPALPIIMVTAFVEEDKLYGLTSGGVDALLLKPFALHDLREAINQVLAGAKPDQTSLPSVTAGPSPALDCVSPA
jgi:CheY-like chemotaxis protein